MRDWGASPEIIMTIEAMDKIDENSGCGMGQSWALMGKRTCRGLSTAGAFVFFFYVCLNLNGGME